MKAFSLGTEDEALLRPLWQKYVRTLCTQAWDFDADETVHVLHQLGQLRDEQVTDAAVVDVLLSAGVSETSALMIAPSIRVSILS